ncbi:MAG: DUF1573 domain-containing protein [Planctomycetaceae bacterium]|nr:DUF1573 domain-containing protein [Planctomycetaceae bacterium]
MKRTAKAVFAALVICQCAFLTSAASAQLGNRNYSYKPAAPAQSWAQSLFSETSHNFGTVARAAKAEHTFSFTNNSEQPIEILSVTASCTCTKPEVPTKLIQPGAEGQVVAKYQTKLFSGQRGATLNVSLKKGNSYGTAILRVDGYIRQDVVVHPESVELPRVLAAEGATNKVKILYAGRSDWKITDVKCEQPGMQFKLTETLRQNGRVEYELETTVPKGHSLGLVQDIITLYTNDKNLTSFPVGLSANIVQPIRFAEVLELKVSEGATAIEKLLLASSSDFQIIDFECESCPVQVKLDGETRKVHQLEVTAEGLNEGRSEHILKLTTNHPQQPVAHVRLIVDVQTGR